MAREDNIIEIYHYRCHLTIGYNILSKIFYLGWIGVVIQQLILIVWDQQ